MEDCAAMTPDQLKRIRDKIASNRQPVFRGEQYSHPRGWNDALDFVERVIKEVLDEPTYRNLDGPVSAGEFESAIIPIGQKHPG